MPLLTVKVAPAAAVTVLPAELPEAGANVPLEPTVIAVLPPSEPLSCSRPTCRR